MSAITLHLPQGMAAITRKSANIILLPVSIASVFGKWRPARREDDETDSLLREVVALKQTKKR
jgi:hypothetical protein